MTPGLQHTAVRSARTAQRGETYELPAQTPALIADLVADHRPTLRLSRYFAIRITPSGNAPSAYS
jgi:hypothetical protein